MTSTGKKLRKSTGLNRHELRYESHTHKSDKKRREMGWPKKGLGKYQSGKKSII